jgi:hypothetical protein
MPECLPFGEELLAYAVRRNFFIGSTHLYVTVSRLTTLTKHRRSFVSACSALGRARMLFIAEAGAATERHLHPRQPDQASEPEA